MQDIFLLGILGSLLPPPVPVDAFYEEHLHEQRNTGTESE